MKSVRIVAIACLLGFLVPPYPSPHGATLVALSLEGLVHYSDVAVIGTPVTTETLRDEHGRIVRDVRVDVGEYVVGEGSPQITIRLLGGTIDGIAQYVPGEIELPLGKPVLLFLERGSPTRPGVFLVTGMAQGRFHVLTNRETGERYVARKLGDLNLVGTPADQDPFGLAKSQTSTFVPLKEFLQAIRALTVRVSK